jgi:hypothetical protein
MKSLHCDINIYLYALVVNPCMTRKKWKGHSIQWVREDPHMVHPTPQDIGDSYIAHTVRFSLEGRHLYPAPARIPYSNRRRHNLEMRNYTEMIGHSYLYVIDLTLQHIVWRMGRTEADNVLIGGGVLGV